MPLNDSIVSVKENVENDNDSFDSNDKFSSSDSNENSGNELADGKYQIISKNNLFCFACGVSGIRYYNLKSDYSLCQPCSTPENKENCATDLVIKYQCDVCHHLGSAKCINGGVF